MSSLGLSDSPLPKFPKLERSRELSSIERDAKWCRWNAESLTRHARGLHILPEFETRAEDELRMAETALSEALLAVKVTLGQFREAREKFSLIAAE